MRLTTYNLTLICLLTPAVRSQTAGAGSGDDVSARESRVVEVAGTVEFRQAGGVDWLRATNGLILHPGDRLRTRAQSRAAVQLSDRGILRLNEETTLEIQPPRRTEKWRFRLPGGSLFFFNRERPADVEFETPVVSGAIRGTEFLLDAVNDGVTRLALLDGLVELTSGDRAVTLQSGEEVEIEAGGEFVKSPLVGVVRLVQWALYYPAVVSPDDLAWSDDDREVLPTVLAEYRNGAVAAAHAAMAAVPSGGEARELLRSALDLSVGRVDVAESRLNQINQASPAARALREIIEVVRDDAMMLDPSRMEKPRTASEALARSYSWQARFRLREAVDAARQAAALAPGFGFAQARVAELEMALDHRQAARERLDQAAQCAPRLAQVSTLRGFLQLEENEARAAWASFDEAVRLDAALDNAWLGRGLALMRLGRPDEALRSLQTAAALNPRRALARSYLGKAFSAQGEAELAEKDFRLAKALDPGDPTPWLYGALHDWQQYRPNAAVRGLERSMALNDNRQVYRSRLLLDRDRAVRSANLAALYEEAGLPEASVRSAARAVNDDYAQFSGHLFLADSYRTREDPSRFDLRYETARLSELLLANLLAPAGAGNLSQLLSQRERGPFFEQRPIGASSLTEYRSSGDWREWATFFGNLDGFSYALDVAYESQHGQEINDALERKELSIQLKQRLGLQDEIYFQAAWSDLEAGDVARHYDPADAIAELEASERQAPNLYAGWHHTWSPAQHTLFLVSRLEDTFKLWNPELTVLHLRTNASGVQQVYGYDDNTSRFDSEFTLYSAELQQIWRGEHHTVVAGGRFQAGDVESHGILSKTFTGVVSDGHISEPLRRANGYLYDHWQVARPLQLSAGLSYDYVIYPENADLLPLREGTDARGLLAPKVGFLLTPWQDGQWRGAYTRSLGGLYFDNSVRLEPTQIVGFNQAWRSLAPEASVGLVPGSEFETAGLAFDQSWPSGTYLGLSGEWLRSEGDRTIGVTAAPFPPPLPGSGSGTRQDLEFLERSFSLYAVQLLGDGLSLGWRYRLSDAQLETRLPRISDTAVDLDLQEQDQQSTLHQVALSLNYQHASGLFGQWESEWYHQNNSGYGNPDRPEENFWQHNLWVGYRLLRRRAEARVGLLNLTDTDYRLNPLNAYQALPRGRTFVGSLRLNF